VTSAVVSPNGKHIVSGSEDGTVRVWDAPRLWDLVLGRRCAVYKVRPHPAFSVLVRHLRRTEGSCVPPGGVRQTKRLPWQGREGGSGEQLRLKPSETREAARGRQRSAQRRRCTFHARGFPAVRSRRHLSGDKSGTSASLEGARGGALLLGRDCRVIAGCREATAARVPPGLRLRVARGAAAGRDAAGPLGGCDECRRQLGRHAGAQREQGRDAEGVGCHLGPAACCHHRGRCEGAPPERVVGVR